MTIPTSIINIFNKDSRLIIGLMSGMSFDGLDLALAKISGTFPNLSIELLDQESFAYSIELKNQISVLKDTSTEIISEMNFVLACFYAECVNSFLKSRNLKAKDIDAIGSHGQTIFHKTMDTKKPSSLQIGSGSVLAKKTGIATISNFREADIALGGNGAPLVPYVDFLLFRNEKLPIAINNLGSISNLTIVTPELKNVLAFDTGPANMPIDYFASKIANNSSKIDLDSRYSRSGEIIKPLLLDFLNNAFLKLPPPKAAGYQEFGPAYCNELHCKYQGYLDNDYVRTAVEFSAQSITNAYINFILPNYPTLSKIIFTGGGSKNLFLIERIATLLPNLDIKSLHATQPEFSDAKEALAFAVLANEFLSQRPANIPNVTGAKDPTILGSLSLP